MFRSLLPSEMDDEGLLDRAGQTILGLLDRAAAVTGENSQRAREAAGKLSHQLRAAEDRVRDLEADLKYHQDRADHAEKWMYQISVEIEQKFFASTDNRSRQAPSRKHSARDNAPPRNQYSPRG